MLGAFYGSRRTSESHQVKFPELAQLTTSAVVAPPKSIEASASQCQEFKRQLEAEVSDAFSVLTPQELQLPLPCDAFTNAHPNEVLVGFIAQGTEVDRVEVALGGDVMAYQVASEPLTIGNKRVFLTWLPKGSAGVPYVARFLAGERALGSVRGVTRAHALQALSLAQASACVDIDIAISDAKNVVLVDGELLEPPAQWALDPNGPSQQRVFLRPVLSAEEHELIVLGYGDAPAVGTSVDAAKAEPTHSPRSSTLPKIIERLRTRFKVTAAGRRCNRVAYDLRALERVALVKVEVEPRCSQAGLTQRQVELAASAYLESELNQRFVDTSAVQSLFDGMSGFSSRFQSKASAASSGRDRGSQEMSRAEAQLAHEYMQRGIQTALMLTAQCARFSNEASWTYTFNVRSLRVSEDKGPVDAVTGYTPPKVTSKTETTNEGSLLAHALISPLARSLGTPYLRFNSPSRAATVHDQYTLSLEEYVPAPSEQPAATPTPGAPATAPDERRQIVVQTRWLSETEAAQVCRRVGDYERLRGPSQDLKALLQSTAWTDLLVPDGTDSPNATHASNGELHSIVLSDTRHQPGDYLMRTGYRTKNDLAVTDWRCVRIAANDRRLALVVSHSWFKNGARNNYSAVSLDYSVPLSVGKVYNARGGFAFGASRATYERDTAPSWAPRLDVGANGKRPISWVVDAATFGVYSDVRGVYGRSSWFFELELPTISIGSLQPTAVPEGLEQFVGGRNGSRVDFDVGALGRVGVGFVFNGMDLALGVQLGLLSMDDLLRGALSDDAEQRFRATIEYDPGITFGPFVELGYLQ